ncbi:TolB family protein [Gemmatimonas sp.]|uniref:TolB family protein n=2 Tax=Gemmatimonas sp. TaxID=1962908 RepID=UPI003564D0F4
MLQLHQSRSIVESLWSPDANWLIYGTFSIQAGVGDILAMQVGADTVPVPLAATPFSEWSPALYPHGRWLAYTSTETGRPEIYVVPFPNAGRAKWPISTSGGTEPTWSHRGDELFYRDGAGHMVAAEVKTTPTFALHRSTVLFSATGFAADFFHRQYAVASDDRRFLMIRAVGGGAPDKLVVVENWFEELKARDNGRKP